MQLSDPAFKLFAGRRSPDDRFADSLLSLFRGISYFKDILVGLDVMPSHAKMNDGGFHGLLKRGIIYKDSLARILFPFFRLPPS
jgi:hypothetical protein